MSGTRHLTAAHAAPARALMVACAVLLCLFGAGPALADVLGEPPPAATAPTEPGAPGEGQSDAADAEVRAALRCAGRSAPVRRAAGTGAPAPAVPAPRELPYEVRDRDVPPSSRAVRSVVLRC
ncbi:hypothetical protein [Streptomyces antimicrobicus]|uniref:Secreted protein n=1 Tax=Streptomyces antimicrobicus TaxID=2883108 RepID=A0ABS8B9R9_9ACTN|nr:hypothetical protein [Streptomyces antimicrobicus]MCB5181276.1 hypothetical protein [Streptomyces antimicrobicus]